MTEDVFLVSDDHDTINFISGYCSALGLGCRTLSSKTLFSSLRVTKPKLVIVDFVLKDAFGGSLCHQLKCDHELQEIKAVLLTDDNSTNRFAPKFGCSHSLTKPLNHDLLNTLFNSIYEPDLQNKLVL